jgi:hypothetical protein
MTTTSAPSMVLTDLPTSLLSEICGLATGSGSPRTIGAVARCCKATRKAAEEGAPWQRSVSLRWGIQARPPALPSWAALSRVLEQDVGQHLRYVDEHSTTSVRKAVAILRRDVLAASADGGRVAVAGSEQVCLHALLRRAPLGLRRRLAAFVCMTSESLPRDSTYMKLFMAGLDLDDLQVRKTPSWPRSWANFSLLQLYSRRNAWANLDIFGQPNIFLARRPPRQRCGPCCCSSPSCPWTPASGPTASSAPLPRPSWSTARRSA